MKFVKGVAIFLVLCFAAYGAFSLLKKPQIDVPESDLARLEEIGVYIQDGKASDSGLSGVFNTVQGVAPVGAAGTSSSSAPPSFLVEPTTSAPTTSFAPPFEASPRVAVVDTADIELQPAPEFSTPEAIELPPVAPPASPLLEAPPFGVQPIPTPTLSPPVLVPPPPPLETWNGPASNIPVTPPPATSLHTPHFPLLSEIPSLAGEKATPIEQTTIRRITMNSNNSGHSCPAVAVESGFSSAESVPLETVPKPAHPYTRTAAKQQSLSFEPIKPEVQPNAPIVSFGPPKRINPPQQPQNSPSPSKSLAAGPAIAQTTPQPAISEAFAQFIQSQRQLVESGNPENMRHAFIQLSQLYEHHQLGHSERTAIQPLLDTLALKVIYARETHILEPPYRVKPGETIETIARDFNLTSPLLRKINGFTATHELPTGTILKVLYGQFDAQISLERHELTLLLGGLYAGRFSFSLPRSGIPVRPGELYVTDKSDQFIVLSNGWVLGMTNIRNATIVFSNHDGREIFDILSEQSVIVLQ